MPPILEVSGLPTPTTRYPEKRKPLSDISFQVETGEFIAIVGPSGCGKSTLLLLNQRAPAAGRRFHSYKWGSTLKSQCRIGYNAAKRPAFRVEDDHPNAALGLEIQKKWIMPRKTASTGS